jgi:hypothetical protein
LAILKSSGKWLAWALLGRDYQTYAKVLDGHRRDAVKRLEEYRQSKIAGRTASADRNIHVK